MCHVCVMKLQKTILAIISTLAVAMSAQAGDEYSAKGGKEVIAQPAPSCLWTWFAGGSAGYVSGDWDEDIYTLHVGAEYKCPGSNCSQAIFLEVGYTEKDERDGARDVSNDNIGNIDAEVIPITLNYKYECALTDKLNWYIGAGAGVALVDISTNEVTASQSEDDTVFYAHAFAGLVYNVSESFEIFGGLRYILMDDPNFFDGIQQEDDFTLDKDIHLEFGGRFNF